MSLCCAAEAVESASISTKHIDPERIGCCIGTGIGNIDDIVSTMEILKEKVPMGR